MVTAPHTHPVRVYYEDTDAGGIVYYANYLKFAERARTELLRSVGLEQAELRQTQGALFVVTACNAQYYQSAQLDDLLHVETQLQAFSKVRMTMEQTIRRDKDKLVHLEVKLACLNSQGNPCKWPAIFTEKLHHYLP